MSDAVIKLSAVDRTRAALDSAKKNLRGLGDESSRLRGLLGSLGLAFVGALAVKGIKNVIDTADELSKLSQTTSLTTEALSQLRYAADLGGVSNEMLTTSLRKLNVSIGEGLAGDKIKMDSFKALGISTADLGKGTQEVFMMIADVYAKSKDGAGKVAIGNDLMGKSASDMIPFLNGGRGSIEDLMREADRLGLTIGKDFGKNAEEFNDNLQRVKVSSERLGIALAQDLVNGLGKAMKAMADAAVEGGTLAGVLAGVQMLLYGDDLHKSNVALVDQTNALLEAENKLLLVRRLNGPAAVSAVTAQHEAKVEAIKAAIALTQNHLSYVRALGAEPATRAREASEKRTALTAAGTSSGAGDAAGKKAASAAAAALKDQDRMVLKDAGFSPSFVKDWQTLSALFASGRYDLEQLTVAQAQLLADQPAIKAQIEAQAELGDIRAKNAAMAAQHLDGLIAENEAQVKSNQSLREEVEGIGLNALALNALRLTRLDANLAREQENLLAAQGLENNDGEVGQIERRINLLRQERDLKAEGFAKEQRASEADDNQRRTEALSASISDGLMDGFRNGKGLADIFLNELKAQFAKTVLQPLITPIVSAGNKALSGAGGDALGDLFKAAVSLFGGGAGAGPVTVQTADQMGTGFAAAFDKYAVPLASGMDYVPYDNFPARLHKGERVMTAAENAGGGGGTVVNNNYTFGAGVSRAEVMAGMRSATAEAVNQVVDGRRRKRF